MMETLTRIVRVCTNFQSVLIGEIRVAHWRELNSGQMENEILISEHDD